MDRCAIACFLAVILTGCRADTDPEVGYLVRDSSGVRIVEYSGTPTSSRSVTLSSEPLYRHGLGAGDYLFQSVWGGALLPDGSAAIADWGNQEVVLIGPEGAFRSVLARSGQGPSEVRRVMGLFALGQDSILLEDDGNARFMLFANGSLARSVSTLGDRTLTQALRAHGIDSTGQVLMATSSYRSGFDVAWLPGHMVRFDLDTGVADTVASYDMAPFAPREGPKNPFPPFGDVSVAGGQFVHGRSDVPQLTWRTPDGETRQIVRWSPDRTYPTADNWAAFESFLQTELPRVNPQLSGADLEQMVQRSLAEYELVGDEPLPIYTTLAGDDEGRVWLGEFSIHSRLNGIPRYTIFASDGGWLGTLEVPARFRVLDVAGGLVLGVVQDEIDVESVVVYELLLTELEG